MQQLMDRENKNAISYIRKKMAQGPLPLAAVVMLGVVSGPVFSADLLTDEQGPTAPEAVTALTANKDFLLPSYAVPATPEATAPVPSEIDILNEIFGSDDPQKTLTPKMVAHNKSGQHTFFPRTGVQSEEKDETPLLTPLPPVSSVPITQVETTLEPKVSVFKQSPLADQALAMATVPSTSDGIGMPREVRITFYPGMSTFSAQALKWVKAFATRAVNDPTLLVEVRISDKNPKIQEKRLNVLFQVLKEVGISAHQVRLYESGRNENSILIGYANNPDYTLGSSKKSKEKVQKTIDW